MNKKTDPNPDDDEAIFKTAMQGVKPMAYTKCIPNPTKPKLKRKKTPQEQNSFSTFSNHENLEPVQSDTLLDFNRPGIQYKSLRKLRTGQYNVEATLDLHGMTVDEASEALHQFLLRCRQENLRHVLVIHGKGLEHKQPILKNKINHWLRQTQQVLAFTSATHKDGRAGATYVLLKKGEQR